MNIHDPEYNDEEDRQTDGGELSYDDLPSCPYCDGDSLPLGTMGRLSWFRCQDCGMDFNG